MAIKRFQNPAHSVFLAFFIYAFSLGMLFPRLGDIQLSLGIGEAVLGLSMLGLPIGLQISLLLADKVLNYVSLPKVMIGGVMALSLSFTAAGLVQTAPQFFTSLLIGGLAIGVIEVAVNLEADRVEYHLKRRIMNRSHAFWSLGFFFTGIMGALMAQLSISPFLHFVSFGIFATAITTFYFNHYKQAAPRPSSGEVAPLFVKPTKAVMVLVFLTLSAMLVEGSAIDWSVIFMRDIFATPPMISGLALALAAFCQFVTRYFADYFVDKYGPQTISHICISIMFVSILLVSLAPHPAIALIGFAGLGAGSSVIFPLAMSAAAQLTDRPAAVNVASLAQIAFVVFLLAPPILGFIAEHIGIRYSFAVSLPLILLSFFNVKGLESPKAQNQSL